MRWKSNVIASMDVLLALAVTKYWPSVRLSLSWGY